MSDGHRRLEEAQQAASLKGCIVIFPDRYTLFIDIDSAEAGRNFDKCLEVLQKTEDAVVMRREPSPSGLPGREHIDVRLNRLMTDEERILLQACLGSDPLREMLSLMRLRAGDEAPTIFFEKKTSKKTSKKSGGVIDCTFDADDIFNGDRR